MSPRAGTKSPASAWPGCVHRPRRLSGALGLEISEADTQMTGWGLGESTSMASGVKTLWDQTLAGPLMISVTWDPCL